MDSESSCYCDTLKQVAIGNVGVRFCCLIVAFVNAISLHPVLVMYTCLFCAIFHTYTDGLIRKI